MTDALPPAESVVGVIVKALKLKLRVLAATEIPMALVMVLHAEVVIVALISVDHGVLPALRVIKATPLPFVRAVFA